MTRPSTPPSPSSLAASAPLASAPPPPPQVPLVTPETDSRLDQLAARYETAKAEKEAAEKALKEITDGIKAELSQRHPGQTEVLLSSPHLTSGPLQLKAVPKWSIDSKKLKVEDPVTYTRWARQSTSWYLNQLRAG